jgi:cell division transport system permease protein
MKHLPFYFREALANFTRGGMLTAAAVLSVSISMLVVGIILILYVNLVSIYDELTSEITVEAYLEDEATSDGRIDQIGKHLDSIIGVLGTEYISKEKAAEDFVGFFPAEKRAMEEVGDNPLPASYRMRVEKRFEDPALMEGLAAEISAVDGIEDVDYGREWLEGLAQVVSMVRLVGLIIAGVLGFASILVVVTTVGMGVYTRRDQISIMKLVGATDAFVRVPFLFEGAAIGLVGAVLALAALYGGYYALFSSDIAVTFLRWEYIAVYLASGVLLGIIGSYIAVMRFLKV